MRSRAEELAMIEAYIAEHGLTVLEPFEEGMARKKWKMAQPMVQWRERPTEGGDSE